MNKLIKITAAILALAVLVPTLSGCAKLKADLPDQVDMPEADLQAAMRRIEYSALAANMHDDEFYHSATKQKPVVSTPGYIGDVDGDGIEDFIYDGFLFNQSDNRSVASFASDDYRGNALDKDNRFYFKNTFGDEHSDYSDHYKKEVWYSCGSTWYSTLFESEYKYLSSGWDIVEVLDEKDPDYNKELEHSESYNINDTDVSKKEYNKKIEELGIEDINTPIMDLTSCFYSAKYTNELLKSLDEHLKNVYNGYTGNIHSDIDGDGNEEAIFFINNYLTPWTKNYKSSLEYYGHEQSENVQLDLLERFPTTTTNTTVIVADIIGDEIVFSGHCVSGSFNTNAQILYKKNYLYLSNNSTFVQDGAISTNMGGSSQAQYNYQGLADYLRGYGYTNFAIRTADVADYEGEELLCFGQREGVWYLLVLSVESGKLVNISTISLENSAYFLIDIKGKTYLFKYYQNASNYDGRAWYSYSYSIFRYNNKGVEKENTAKSISYYSDDKDATKAAKFFDAFNKKVKKAVALHDPFNITGTMWLSADTLVYGTVPADLSYSTGYGENAEESYTGGAESSTTTQTGTSGYVDIEEADSWLHLRTGPGTQYDKVLLDPKDPKSFVKQAKGAPVTVLETIETGDSKNPVWVKIRINYADRELIGYSSKTYIKLYDEYTQ